MIGLTNDSALPKDSNLTNGEFVPVAAGHQIIDLTNAEIFLEPANAMRKDLGKVRGWLETSNPELGKTTGIRWLRKETTLREEGKKTSSVVVYLETTKEAGKVRLGGKWLRTEIYEPDRGRR
ncbi:hypothetical protein BDZ91DRAFT_795335 [Kalaharituber pfeilii]|nr:hypothetical protein BDZ91DRAFT_795335 [Kalaharituber pfeilii]